VMEVLSDLHHFYCSHLGDFEKDFGSPLSVTVHT